MSTLQVALVAIWFMIHSYRMDKLADRIRNLEKEDENDSTCCNS